MIQLNGIQHFSYCPRQWALINIEQVWQENEDTAMGHLVHQIADDPFFEEVRGDRIITRAVPISSVQLGFSGIIDVLEYHKETSGIHLKNHTGKWVPFIVEYKKGRPKKNDCDIMQLVAQAMCLEEMYGVQLQKGALYYKTTNQRIAVELTEGLRDRVRSISKEMHSLLDKGITPKAQSGKNCKKCSLQDICWPRLTHHRRSVTAYITRAWEELDEEIT